MTPTRWQEIERIYNAALQRAPGERTAFLAEACGEDAELRHEVEALLAQVSDGEITKSMAAPFAFGAGMEIRHYRIESKLGEGGMGAVYRAMDTKLNRPVAIKVLSGNLADAEARRRFQREAQLASSLNHPHILTVYDAGEIDGRQYLVTEYIDGGTLRDWAKEQKRTWKQVIELLTGIADGLAAAHEAKIVHRDIKPANILVARNGYAKLVDFGLAKLAEGSQFDVARSVNEAGTQKGMIVGTIPYMSPEQASGQPLDARSDIFSFGVVLYELLANRRPFTGTTDLELLKTIVHAEPQPLAEDMPLPLRALVEKALEKDPAERYQSMRELTIDLRRLAHRQSAETAAVAIAKPERRRAWLGWTAAAVLVVLAAALLLWRTLPGRASSETHTIALLPLENLSADPSQNYFTEGMTEQLITDLSKIGSLHVISRASVMRYRGDRRNLKEIAKELGVDMILTGTVMRVEGRVRINAQLFQMPEEKNLWAESFDRDLKDVLTLQAGVARTVAEQIRVRLTPQEQIRLAAVSPIDPATHELYLQGRFFANQFTEEGLTKGIEYFQRAVSRNPNYAEAYSGIASGYTQLASYYRSPKETMPVAREAALKALQLDSSLAEPHIWLGMIQLYFDWDWPGAERELKRALDLNPSSADAHLLYEHLLSALGRLDEATQEAKRALDLDPLSVRMLIEAQFTYLLAGQYDRTIAIGNKLAEIESQIGVGHVYTGLAYAQQKQIDPALRELELAVKLDPNNVTAKGFLAHVRALAGDRDGAHRILDELKVRNSKRYTCAFEIAMAYSTLGEKDEAFRWLDKGVQDRADCMIWMKSEPWMKPLQSDARFQGIAAKVGLP